MKANNINNILTKSLNITNISGGQKMPSAIKYDNFMQNLTDKIKSKDFDSSTKLLMAMVDKGALEQVRGNLYKHKDFHILELLKSDGVNYAQKLKTLDKLNLSITQKFIETIDKEGSIYIVTKIPGTEKENLAPLWKIGNNNIPKENRLAAFHDLQKLTKSGLTDDSISNSNRLWYVTSENKIILPIFDYLRHINPKESQKEIIEKFYNILFK